MIIHAILGLPPLALAALVAVFVLGGVVKGVTGVGLPLVLVPLAAQFLDVPVAVALLTVPMVATNITQAIEGGHTLAAIRAMWPILVCVVIGTVDRRAPAAQHRPASAEPHPRHQLSGVSRRCCCSCGGCASATRPRAGPGRLVGFAAGVLGGMSAMFGPPMIAYLVGRGTDPDSFVKQMAIFAFTASATMLLALGG